MATVLKYTPPAPNTASTF